MYEAVKKALTQEDQLFIKEFNQKYGYEHDQMIEESEAKKYIELYRKVYKTQGK
jgi:hypothetical protein